MHLLKRRNTQSQCTTCNGYCILTRYENCMDVDCCPWIFFGQGHMKHFMRSVWYITSYSSCCSIQCDVLHRTILRRRRRSISISAIFPVILYPFYSCIHSLILHSVSTTKINKPKRGKRWHNLFCAIFEIQTKLLWIPFSIVLKWETFSKRKTIFENFGHSSQQISVEWKQTCIHSNSHTHIYIPSNYSWKNFCSSG